MDMQFVSEEHKRFYEENRSITEKGRDFQALVYTLGINPDCRKRFSRMYNDEERVIIPDVIFEGWQTSGSVRITRLAFHLFTWHAMEDDEPENYFPKNLFHGLDDTHRQGALLALTYFA